MQNTGFNDKGEVLNNLQPHITNTSEAIKGNELVDVIQRFNNCNPAYVFLTTKETAVFLRVSPKKLEADRLHGTGPPFKKVGAKVIYCLKELLTYLEDNTRLNTCK